MKRLLFIIILMYAFISMAAQTHNVTRGKQVSSQGTSRKKNTSATSKHGTVKKKNDTSKDNSQFDKKRIIDNLIKNMVYVEGGTFMMGATPEQGSDAMDSERPIHQVFLSSFYIGRYEVTQEEWEAVMGNNPSNRKSSKYPVTNITWYDCQEFIIRLNQITGLNFRLPTEAEWEFAARGGNLSRGFKFAGGNDIDAVAWYDSHHHDGLSIHSVGKKRPNELGLYDMSGNVDEWCNDWFGPYSANSCSNPKGSISGKYRVWRSGRGYDSYHWCRVSRRGEGDPMNYDGCLGLRLAL